LKHILCSIIFPPNFAVYEITWKGMVQPDRTQTTIKFGADQTRFACIVTKEKNTDTRSEYLLLITLPWQQWLCELACCFIRTLQVSLNYLTIRWLCPCGPKPLKSLGPMLIDRGKPQRSEIRLSICLLRPIHTRSKPCPCRFPAMPRPCPAPTVPCPSWKSAW